MRLYGISAREDKLGIVGQGRNKLENCVRGMSWEYGEDKSGEKVQMEHCRNGGPVEYK